MDITAIVALLLTLYVARKLYLALNPSFISSQNKAILVTGCDSGFGLQLGLRAVDDGFHVFAGCLSVDSAGAKQLKEKGCDVLVMDVTKQKDIDEALVLVQRVLTERGLSLHGVVNNAGVNLSIGPVEWAAPESVEKVLNVNTLGVVRVTRTFLPLVRKVQGRIVNVCSMAAHIASPTILPYSMSKVATYFFTNGLRREMRAFGVHVASISPFFYATNIVNKEIIKKAVERTWAEASPSAKAEYGKTVYDKIYAGVTRQNTMARHQTWEVIDCMMDALTNRNPKCDYVPGIFVRLYKFILDMIPLSWSDKFITWSMKLRR